MLVLVKVHDGESRDCEKLSVRNIARVAPRHVEL